MFILRSISQFSPGNHISQFMLPTGFHLGFANRKLCQEISWEQGTSLGISPPLSTSDLWPLIETRVAPSWSSRSWETLALVLVTAPCVVAPPGLAWWAIDFWDADWLAYWPFQLVVISSCITFLLQPPGVSCFPDWTLLRQHMTMAYIFGHQEGLLLSIWIPQRPQAPNHPSTRWCTLLDSESWVLIPTVQLPSPALWP